VQATAAVAAADVTPASSRVFTISTSSLHTLVARGKLMQANGTNLNPVFSLLSKWTDMLHLCVEELKI
jgi:hypothetical protein